MMEAAKTSETSTSLHGATIRKTAIFIKSIFHCISYLNPTLEQKLAKEQILFFMYPAWIRVSLSSAKKCFLALCTDIILHRQRDEWSLIALWWRQQAPLKRRWTSTRLHGATTQKTAIFILAVVRTWNLTQFNHLIYSVPFFNTSAAPIRSIQQNAHEATTLDGQVCSPRALNRKGNLQTRGWVCWLRGNTHTHHFLVFKLIAFRRFINNDSFAVNKVAMVQVFLRILRFYPVSIIPSMLYIHSCVIWRVDNGPVSCRSSTEAKTHSKIWE
jgi:hypothetical protein